VSSAESAPRDRTTRRLVWASASFIAVGSSIGIALDLASGRFSEVVFSFLLLTFPAVGFVVLARRPRETLGWLMLAMGFVIALPFGAYGYYALSRDPRLAFGPLALALGAPTWVAFIGISGYLLLLFPDGHLPSPRWRWFAWGCGIGMGSVAFFIWTFPGPAEDAGFPDVVNPIGIDALEPYVDMITPLLLSAPILVLGGAVALVVRLRRTHDPAVRHQIRWLAYAASVIALLYAVAFVAGNSGWTSWLNNVSVVSFVLIPLSIGVAVMRYRLYDIDIVIKKTVVVAVLVAFIALVYVAIVAGVGALVGSTGNGWLSAIAAAVVALVFQPVRARARHLADRVVYGKRATPYEVMAEFGGNLAGSYSSVDVLPRLARVLGEGVGAERSQVWLEVDGSMRPVATWPTDSDPSIDDDLRVEVLHEGRELGALSVAMAVNDPLDPIREQLVRDLAGQAGLVLSNVRLTEQLRARLDDLGAAQRRLVAAQDEERRRLERNIHDGAQQQLVALTIKARLARQLTDRDPGKAAEVLEQIEVETQTALEDLRDLARGIYPPLLADKGLAAALEAQARRSPVPITVEADGLGRYPQDVEAAVYFSTLEALQNVAKYAEATRASVTLAQRDGALTFTVTDDGHGFDPASTGYGTGLQGIADRLGALDGSLEVASSPGAGTRIHGTVSAPGEEAHG
jgi:signal transduction histidine kinase